MRNRVVVFDRGGVRRIGELSGVRSVTWSRQRDDISTCDVAVSYTPECMGLLAEIEPARHEFVVYRDGQRVWEGPVTLANMGREDAEFQARDVMHYAYRTIMRGAYDNRYPNVTSTITRAHTILSTELARKEALDPPINVVDHIVAVNQVDDARTARATVPFQKTVFEEVDDIARVAGMDYTVLGRSIILFDTHTALSRTPVLTEVDVSGDFRVVRYGMQTATFAASISGEGVYGYAGGNDGYYGQIEILDSAYEEGASETDPPTANELAQQAQRNLSNKIPTPTIVRIPDSSTLNPTSQITLDQLVPGVQVPLRLDIAGRVYSQMQKLDRVVVSEGPGGETVQISLSPAVNTGLIDGEEG